MLRIIITLNEQEKKALIVLAEREMRDPRAQAALIIRKALEFEGLISAMDSEPLETVENEEKNQ